MGMSPPASAPPLGVAGAVRPLAESVRGFLAEPPSEAWSRLGRRTALPAGEPCAGVAAAAAAAEGALVSGDRRFGRPTPGTAKPSGSGMLAMVKSAAALFMPSPASGRSRVLVSCPAAASRPDRAGTASAGRHSGMSGSTPPPGAGGGASMGPPGLGGPAGILAASAQ